MAGIRWKKENTAPSRGASSGPPPSDGDGYPHLTEEEDAIDFTRESTSGGGLFSRQEIRRALVSLAAAILLFSACIAVWLGWDSFSYDSLTGTADTAASAKEEYVLESGSGQVFAKAGSGLAAASTSGLELIDENARLAASHLFQLASPAVAACQDYAVFYDLGGTNMAAAWFDGTVRELTPAGNIISATVSSGGYLAVTTDCTGYRALVTVYDADLQSVYRWYSSSAWVISAEVSPDGRELVVLSYTSSGSEVRFFSLGKTEQQASFSVDDTVLLDVHWLSSSQLCAYSTEQAIFFTSKGQLSGAYHFNGLYLTACTFDGDGFCAFALSPYRSGTTSALVALNAGGEALGTADIQSEIVCLTASGAEVLVLCPDTALLYGSTLGEKGRLTGLTGFKYGLLRSRGEALLISANYAEVYVFS